MAKNKNNQAIWNTRIKKNGSTLFQKVGNSIDVDKRLYKEDIQGSVAHIEMLFKHIDESERNLVKGSIVTAPHIATNSNMRSWLGRDLGVDSIDQDAAYTALACSEMSMPFGIIRGITSQESSSFPQSRYQVDRRVRSLKSNVPYTPYRISDYIKFRLGRRIVSSRMDQILTRVNSLSVP